MEGWCGRCMWPASRCGGGPWMADATADAPRRCRRRVELAHQGLPARLQVFWAQRRSTPDLSSLAERLAADPEADIPSSIGFDSLQSLPTTLPWLRGGGGGGSGGGGGGQAPSTWQPHEGGGITGSADQLPAVPGQVASLMRQPTFEAVAAALRQRLGLTLFGFDLVFDRVAGEGGVASVPGDLF